MKNIAVIIGTRPEVIKLAPVIRELKNNIFFKTTVVFSGQHKELLEGIPAEFEIAPDVVLDVPKFSELSQLRALTLVAFTQLFETKKFDAVLVQGDTSTALSAAEAAFYKNIPVGHVEAGLRSFDMRQPFPEEMNRIFISRISTWHFCPTQGAYKNLLQEGYLKESLSVTGNTVLDSLDFIFKAEDSKEKINFEGYSALMTIHRRESHGPILRNFFSKLKIMLEEEKDLKIIYPYHLNPAVADLAKEFFQDCSQVELVPPLTYRPLVKILSQVDFVLTDSGGLQEETPYFQKPVLILRDRTERPEVVEAGYGKLVGTAEFAVEEVRMMLKKLRERKFPDWFIGSQNPFGDGKAAKRIVTFLESALTSNPPAFGEKSPQASI